MCDHGSEGEDCDLPAIRGGHARGRHGAGVHRNRGLLDGHPEGAVSQREYTTSTYASVLFETRRFSLLPSGI
jgi:hypothetical protein